MKIYKTTFATKFSYILLVEFPLLVAGFCVIFLIKDAPVHIKFIFILLIVISLLCFSLLILGRCIVDEEKIVFRFVAFILKDTIYWKDIDRMDSYSLLVPDRFTPLSIYSLDNNRTRPIQIDISSFPLELLNDILQNTPSTAAVKLDPSIKKRYIEEYGDKVFEKFEKVED